MNDRSSPLGQRVRRLLGTGSLHPEGENHSTSDEIAERLKTIEQQLNELAARLPSADAAPLAFNEALATLEKQVVRAGREQLKANSLIESRFDQLAALLEALNSSDERRLAETALLREQSRLAREEARLDMVRNMLPVIDGIDEAIRSGRRILEAHASANLPATPFGRMLSQVGALQRDELPLREALASWLTGLEFVRQRLFDLIAADGVRPMLAEGRTFDPRLHIALEVVAPTPAAPTGTVVAELRRGYLHGERILRHAEVAVTGEHGAAKEKL